MRRLLVVYGATLTAAVLLALLVPLGLLARTLAHDRALTAARQEAQGLTVIAADAARGQLSEAVQALNRGARRTTVFLPDRSTVGAPAGWTPSVELARRGRAFTAVARGGEQVLLPVAGRGGVAVIRTFVPASELRAGVGAAWVTLAVVGIVLLSTAVLIGVAVARRLSRSVTELADVAVRMGVGDLSATVKPSGPPELVSVGKVLNSLGARIAEMLAQERALSADLSHRLRTPVTALRLDVEGLRDPDERKRMAGHVDSLTASVDAAVTAARKPRTGVLCSRCDAGRVVRERSAFWSVLSEETGRQLTVSTPAEPALVGLPSDLLGAALDALIDNVFSHTPAGTCFALTVMTDPSRVDVVVADHGPGMPAMPRAADQRGRPGSTGIGLEVARRTVEQAGGTLLEGNQGSGGARVIMRFPSLAQS